MLRPSSSFATLAALLLLALPACSGLAGADFDGWSRAADGTGAGDDTSTATSPSDPADPPSSPGAHDDGGSPSDPPDSGKGTDGGQGTDAGTDSGHKPAAFTACVVTPFDCATECASIGKTPTNGCGPGAKYGVEVDDYDYDDCSDTAPYYSTKSPNYTWDDTDYGSGRCCCY